MLHFREQQLKEKQLKKFWLIYRLSLLPFATMVVVFTITIYFGK
jgi:hypothetical protein